jgi:hypothetical protein
LQAKAQAISTGETHDPDDARRSGNRQGSAWSLAPRPRPMIRA